MTQANTPKLEFKLSRQFTSWLNEMGTSLCFTTYQAGKIFMVGPGDGKDLSITERTLERCMGLAYEGSSLYVSSLYQLWRFENFMAGSNATADHDACFVPQMSYVTGDIDIHDMAVGKDDLYFVNSLFSCIAKPSHSHSFEPVWQPDFISKLAAEDRCHLNGLCLDNGDPAYATLVGPADVADGWRAHRQEGGQLLDIKDNKILCDGLSMPHSPRLYNDTLYILNSGSGEFGSIDRKTGDFTPIAFCPGFARGMTFINGFAVIGLSLPRHNDTFSGLALDDALASRGAQPVCGLIVIDLASGDTVHWLHLEGVVTELFDVCALPGITKPQLIGFRSDQIRRMIRIAP